MSRAPDHITHVRLIVLLCVAVTGISAQEQAAGQKRETEPEEEREEARIEAEFVASDVFRDGTAIIRIWRGLHLESEYLGGPTYDVGVAGAAWKFRWKALSVSPGLAVGFGSPVRTGLVFTFRWTFDTRRVFSQGFFAESFRGQLVEEEAESSHETGTMPVAEEHNVHTSILDNNHVSLRLGPMEIGPMWERIKYREEKEWKGGLRFAVRIRKGIKLIFQTVAPDVEFRGGIAFDR